MSLSSDQKRCSGDDYTEFDVGASSNGISKDVCNKQCKMCGECNFAVCINVLKPDGDPKSGRCAQCWGFRSCDAPYTDHVSKVRVFQKIESTTAAAALAGNHHPLKTTE